MTICFPNSISYSWYKYSVDLTSSSYLNAFQDNNLEPQIVISKRLNLKLIRNQMKFVFLLFVQCLGYFARNIPGAISLQNRIRQEHSRHSHDRCLFRGKNDSIRLFSPTIILALEYMGKCNGVIQREYMHKIKALANSLRGSLWFVIYDSLLMTLFSDVIEYVDKMDGREKNVTSNVKLCLSFRHHDWWNCR